MKIVIASNNLHKIREFKSHLAAQKNLELISLSDFGIAADTEENGISLEENSLIKARAVFNLISIPVISDDTGLFVMALNGKPGVHSARYAGENASYADNRNKLLNELKNVPDIKRGAYFETVICFLVNEKNYYFFKGMCKGKIINEERGINGFGYDSIFKPEETDLTFAEMQEADKNKISHRGRALTDFASYLGKNFTQ